MNRLRKQLLALSLGTVLAFSAASGALAGSDNHTAPGDPGAKNCAGQTTAFLAQAGAELGAPGIGNLADLAGLSVKEVKAIVAAYCAAP